MKMTRRQMQARIEELEHGLEESIKLQSHYAKLLNVWDGGERRGFGSGETWLRRLRELKAKVKPIPTHK